MRCVSDIRAGLEAERLELYAKLAGLKALRAEMRKKRKKK